MKILGVDPGIHGGLAIVIANGDGMAQLVDAIDIPVTGVAAHGLRGGEKESGRQRALQLFLAAHALLTRKKDHGRAEATLIALYGAKSS